jgi:hypothetical protein
LQTSSWPLVREQWRSARGRLPRAHEQSRPILLKVVVLEGNAGVVRADAGNERLAAALSKYREALEAALPESGLD